MVISYLRVLTYLVMCCDSIYRRKNYFFTWMGSFLLELLVYVAV